MEREDGGQRIEDGRSKIEGIICMLYIGFTGDFKSRVKTRLSAGWSDAGSEAERLQRLLRAVHL